MLIQSRLIKNLLVMKGDMKFDVEENFAEGNVSMSVEGGLGKCGLSRQSQQQD